MRIELVEQFCSWSAWRMNSTSSARASTGLWCEFGLREPTGSRPWNIMLRKFSA